MEVGGNKWVVTENARSETAVYNSCQNANISIDVISKLLEVGGNDLVMRKN